MSAGADETSGAGRPPGGWLRAGLFLVLVLLLSFRFLNLDQAPPGFYVDEAAIAAQVICVRQSGRSVTGESWPLYADVLGGGQASPPTLYLGAAWTALFGDSVAAFRGFAGAAGLLVILAAANVARQLTPASGVLTLTLLTAASSPWLFHLSRVFWDPIFGAALWACALAVYFTIRHPPPERMRLGGWLLFGGLSTLAAYAYPPIRIQVAVSWVLLASFDRGLRLWQGWLAATTIAGLIGVPLIIQYLDPGFRARGAMLAIWNEGWLTEQGKRLSDLPGILFSQLTDHLRPAYLFFSGDGNLRHGSRYGGLIGPVEWLVVAAALLCAQLPRRETLLLIGLVVAGILPSALTWESTPHALRSLGAVGPWLMLVGLLVGQLLSAPSATASRRPWIVIPLLAAIWGAFYWHDYVGRFSTAARPWFDADAKPLEDRRYPTLARRYYELSAGARCHPQ